MDRERLKKHLVFIAGESSVLTDEPLALHTSFKIGGPADFMVLPSETEQIADIIKFCRSENVPLYVMGNGTNLIVRDKGIKGVVVKTVGAFNKYKVNDTEITAEAGVLLSRLASAALKSSLRGLEFASGIPGTLGGAVAMNAGAYGPEMKDVVTETEYMDMQGDIHTIKGSQHEFGYRTSIIQKINGLVLKSRISLQKGDPDEIRRTMDDLNSRRKNMQPLEFPSAGSIFRRPAGHFAGRLIEDCGFRGARIGGAQVSEKHCGFIINTGNATAKDVLMLIEKIQKTVAEKYGTELVTEVKVIGEE